MADKKISELTEKNTPVNDDLLALVDSEANPIETKKIKASNITKIHSDLATGVHGVSSDYVCGAKSSGIKARDFVKGWTSGKLIKGAGVDANPTEIDPPGFEVSRVEVWPSGTQTISSAGGQFPVMLDDEKVDALNEFSIVKKTGTATATTANHLIDTTKNQFVSADVGRYVWNTTDNTYAVITACNSESDVTLSADIMASGENYTLFATRFTAKNAGFYIFKGSVRFASSIVADKYYGVFFSKNIQTGTGVAPQYGYVLSHSSYTGSLLVPAIALLQLDANDFIDMWAQVSASIGSAININAGNLYQTHIYITRLS